MVTAEEKVLLFTGVLYLDQDHWDDCAIKLNTHKRLTAYICRLNSQAKQRGLYKERGH